MRTFSGGADESAGTRRALRRFVLASIVVAIIVGAVGAAAGRRAARNESIDQARRATETLARSVVQPHVDASLLIGDPDAIARLDAVVPGKVTSGALVRVKIWTSEGRIVYSDQHELIGSTYPLGDEEADAIADNRVEAELTDLTAPENRFERDQGEMLEVYLPIRADDGTTLLFETYSRYRQVVTAPAGSVWRNFIPITIGALLILQLLQFPLVWGVTRRLERSLKERERLAREAAEASAGERRRIAADLHDSVVQDLAAVSYSLSGAVRHPNGNGNGTSNGTGNGTSPVDPQSALLASAASTVRRSIQTLRTLLVELYPDSLHTEGLAAALSDLAAPLRGRGVEVRLVVADQLGLSRADVELVHRVAAEALRNVAAHAGASSVSVTVHRHEENVRLCVADDGRGIDPAEARSPGHLGLPLLFDRAAQAGGSLTIGPRDDGRRGTVVRLTVPVAGTLVAGGSR